MIKSILYPLSISFSINFLEWLWHFMKSVQIRSFFWSVFSRIWTEYGEILGISPYLVRMRENTDQKKLRTWTHFTQCDSLQILNIFDSKSLAVEIISFSEYGCCDFVLTKFWRSLGFQRRVTSSLTCCS